MNVGVLHEVRSYSGRFKTYISKKSKSMKKNTILCVDLKTVMQNDVLLEKDKCYNGVMTRDGIDHYRFEEAVRKGRPPRNPKLFDGKYCSLVHMQNGKYKIHMKTIDASTVADRQLLAYEVYAEVLKAFNVID